MTRKQGTTGVIDVKALLDADGDYLRAMVRAIVEATLEAEMTAALGAEKSERTSGRLGYRSGYYTRTLITRVGTDEDLPLLRSLLTFLTWSMIPSEIRYLSSLHNLCVTAHPCAGFPLTG